MDARIILRTQLQDAHAQLESVMDGVTRAQAAWIPPGGAYPMGASYARVLILEDAIVNALLKGDRPLFSTTWEDRVGVSDCMPLPDGIWPDFSGPGWHEYGAWARSVRVGLLGLRRYAQAVYATSDEYIVSVAPGDLERPVDLSGLGMGRVPLAVVVGRVLVAQADVARGEISCLKSLQGQ